MQNRIITTINHLLKREHILSDGKPPSAGAIILQEADGELKVALARRKDKNKLWVVPKGRVEPGESTEQAALREIYEETGLSRVQLIKYLGVVQRQSSKSNGATTRKIIHYYLAYAFQNGQSLKPTDTSFAKPGWFTLREAIDLLSYEEERSFFSEQLEALLSEKTSS